MTFLELAQRLRQEAGIAGSGPATVIGQTGELGRIVSWVLSADEDIQNTYANWKFLQTSFTFPTIDTIQSYAPADVSLSDLATWKHDRIDDLTIYSSAADEQYLIFIPWDEFQGAYMFGSTRTQTGRPTIVTIKPDNSIYLWTIPDDVYTVTGEYFKKAQAMSVDISEPIIPSQFHMIIVWKGLMLYSAYNSAPDLYAHGQAEYRNILRKLEKSQLPEIELGEPLA